MNTFSRREFLLGSSALGTTALLSSTSKAKAQDINIICLPGCLPGCLRWRGHYPGALIGEPTSVNLTRIESKQEKGLNIHGIIGATFLLILYSLLKVRTRQE